MVELDTNGVIITAIKDDLKLGLEEILKDPAFGQMIEDLINAKNKEELSNIMANKFLDGYHNGLMKCYDLLKKYDRLQVYEAIESFDENGFYKRLLKTCLFYSININVG